jgi:pyridoxine 4-dehydrogenase
MPTILGKDVGPIGYGMATLSTPPKFPPEEQAIECLRTAAELGALCFNAGEFYGLPTHNSLKLLQRFYSKYPEYEEKALVNVKGAMLPTFVPSGDPTVVRKSVETCLNQLGGKGRIDMFELARRDMSVPLDVQLGTLRDMVQEGKIGGVALTEVNAETIKEAMKIVDIAAVEIELSLWCTDPLHNGILDTCAELGIPVMA